MKLEIVTPNGIVFDGEVEYFMYRGQDGDTAILKDHIPTVGVFKVGYIKAVSSTEKYFLLESAVVEFKNNIGNVMAQLAIEGTSLDDVQSKFLEYLQDVKKEQKRQNVDYTKIEQDLQKSIKEVKAGKL